MIMNQKINSNSTGIGAINGLVLLRMKYIQIFEGRLIPLQQESIYFNAASAHFLLVS